MYRNYEVTVLPSVPSVPVFPSLEGCGNISEAEAEWWFQCWNIGTIGMQQQISLILSDVLRVIEKLPHSLVVGTADGPIASHFSNFDINPEEGPYFTVNCAWEWTFQKTGEAAITGGQYGVKLVHNFLAHFLHIPGIEDNGGLDLMLRRVHQLAEMLQKVSVAARAKDGNGPTSGLKIKLKKGVSKPSAPNKQANQRCLWWSFY
ncbi:hypothetical protein PAXINDRAFT_7753 [Paxillus involutus ATCC 200175]|nr:hypothetical protein PAXINDRAFT_7753 [Paxillus involutus ATCC 200175]